MEAKYYTPDLEEFHAEFEYEQYFDWIEQNNGIATWDKKTISDHENLASIKLYLYKKEIRAKLLDREDIESLGWLYYVVFNDFKFKEHTLTFENQFVKIKVPGDYDHEETHFHGKIKNKSELKRLMIQLGIQ